MRLILDTHSLLWWLADDRRLSGAARDAIAGSESVSVSAVSVWEIAIKESTGKLRAPGDLEHQLAHHGFTALPISIRHAIEAGALPRHHGDPFDRMLVAQAQLEGLTLVTQDRHFAAYGIPLLAA